MRRARSRSRCVAACGGTYGGQPPSIRRRAAAKPQRGIEARGAAVHVLDAQTGHQVDDDRVLGQARDRARGVRRRGAHEPAPSLGPARGRAPPREAVAARSRSAWRCSSARSRACSTTTRPSGSTRPRCARAPAGKIAGATTSASIGPTIAVAVDAHAALLALNAAKELTQEGRASRPRVADARRAARSSRELDLDDKTHRAWFDALMEDMGGGSARAQRRTATGRRRQTASRASGDDADRRCRAPIASTPCR